MSDIDRIMGRPVERSAILVWNDTVLIEVEPSEFDEMKKIIEREGEENFSDDDNGSFATQINWFRIGEDSGYHEFTVKEFDEWLIAQKDDEPQ